MTTIKLKRFDLETKQGKLFKALVLDKETLSEAQIAKRFAIKNEIIAINGEKVTWKSDKNDSN